MAELNMKFKSILSHAPARPFQTGLRAWKKMAGKWLSVKSNRF